MSAVVTNSTELSQENTVNMSFVYPFGIIGDQASGDGCADIDGVAWNSPLGTTSYRDDIIPFDPFYGFGFGAIMFQQSEIGSAKQITEMGIKLGTTVSFTKTNVTVKMYHTSDNDFPSSPTTNLSTQMNGTDITTVLDDGTFSISGVINDYDSPFTFAENFCYNGLDNIVIQFENRQGSPYSNTSYAFYGNNVAQAGQGKGVSGRTDSSYANITVAVTNFRNHIKLYH